MGSSPSLPSALSLKALAYTWRLWLHFHCEAPIVVLLCKPMRLGISSTSSFFYIAYNLHCEPLPFNHSILPGAATGDSTKL
jgi:hypothetical protein